MLQSQRRTAPPHGNRPLARRTTHDFASPRSLYGTRSSCTEIAPSSQHVRMPPRPSAENSNVGRLHEPLTFSVLHSPVSCLSCRQTLQVPERDGVADGAAIHDHLRTRPFSHNAELVHPRRRPSQQNAIEQTTANEPKVVLRRSLVTKIENTRGDAGCWVIIQERRGAVDTIRNAV